MNLIFLSTDGVLSNQHYIQLIVGRGQDYALNHQNQIDKSKLSLINYLVSKTNSDVVLMGSWRLQHSLNRLNDMLQKSGARFKAIDCTPYIYRSQHGVLKNHIDELDKFIYDFSRKNGEINNFVILDDKSDWDHFSNNLVKINYDKGIKHSDIEKCFDKFNISYKKY